MTATPKKVLIVSPHFPPISAADMHRVRMSLPFFRECGWEPMVLTVKADADSGVRDPLLDQTVPRDVPLRRVNALPLAWTRRIGIGSLALRAWPYLYSAGARLMREQQIDLVYFSTTEFLVMPLGRTWKRRFGVPFVVDMQDLWVPDYQSQSDSNGWPKHALMRRVHELMEPWTARAVDGLVAVSPDYLKTLRSRYPWLEHRPAEVLPFGAAEDDFRILRGNPRPNPLFRPGDGLAHGVYVGRGGPDMAPALKIAFRALADGVRECPELFDKVRLHFVGTSYAADDRARKTIEPLAEAAGLSGRVTEHVQRVPYFDALQLLADADFLFVPGSDDAMYSPSKIYPYILAGRPLLGVFAAGGLAVDVIRRTKAGDVVEFGSGNGTGRVTADLRELWTALLRRLRDRQPTTDIDREAFDAYSAREMTRRQCALFDQVLAARGKQPA